MRDSTAWAFRIPASSRTRAAQRRAVGTSRRGSLGRGSFNSKARTSVLSKPYRGGRAFIKVGETRSPVCRTSRPRRTRAPLLWSLVSRVLRPTPHRPRERHTRLVPGFKAVDHEALPALDEGAGGRNVRPRPDPRRMTSSVHLSVVLTRLVQRTRPAKDRRSRCQPPARSSRVIAKTRVLRVAPSVPTASFGSWPSRRKPARSATLALGRFRGSHRISTRLAARASKANASMPRTASVA